jgi:predicted outer membrane protein
MKRAGILAVAFATAMSMSGAASAQAPAAGGGQPPSGVPNPGTAEPGRMPPQQPGTLDTGAPRGDSTREFFEKAAIGNMAEIELGKLAAERAQNAEVKQFAQTMVDAHTKALSELKEAASSASVTIPTELDKKHQKKMDKLSKLNGAEFDKEYIDAMVDAHKDMSKLLENESKQAGSAPVGTSGTASGTSATGTAPTGGAATGTAGEANAGAMQARQWAAQTLPEVEQHLDRAKQIEDSLKNANRSNPAGATPGTNPDGASPGATPPSSGGSSGSSGGGATPPRL